MEDCVAVHSGVVHTECGVACCQIVRVGGVFNGVRGALVGIDAVLPSAVLALSLFVILAQLSEMGFGEDFTKLHDVLVKAKMDLSGKALSFRDVMLSTSGMCHGVQVSSSVFRQSNRMCYRVCYTQK